MSDTLANFVDSIRIGRTRLQCSAPECTNVVVLNGMCRKHWDAHKAANSRPQRTKPLDYAPRYIATGNTTVAMRLDAAEWNALDALAKRRNIRRALLAKAALLEVLRREGLLT